MVLSGGANNEDAFLLFASIWSEVSFSETFPEELVGAAVMVQTASPALGCKRGRVASSPYLKTVTSSVP